MSDACSGDAEDGFSALAADVEPGEEPIFLPRCGAARWTVERWTAWWTEALPKSAFLARSARLMPPVDEARLPAELLVRFVGDRDDALFKALDFIAPITTGPRSSSFPMGRWDLRWMERVF